MLESGKKYSCLEGQNVRKTKCFNNYYEAWSASKHSDCSVGLYRKSAFRFILLSHRRFMESVGITVNIHLQPQLDATIPGTSLKTIVLSAS